MKLFLSLLFFSTLGFSQCYTDPARLNAILTDVEDGHGREVNATPTFFIGEDRVVGGVLDSDGARIIEKELRK